MSFQSETSQETGHGFFSQASSSIFGPFGARLCDSSATAPRQLQTTKLVRSKEIGQYRENPISASSVWGVFVFSFSEFTNADVLVMYVANISIICLLQVLWRHMIAAFF